MQKTNISWADYSSNILRTRHLTTGKMGWACTLISPGCQNCYSQALNLRLGTGEPFTALGNAQVEWVLHEPELHAIWRGKPRRKVFLVDMSDLYHDAVHDLWLDQIFAAVWNASHTIYQTLTKRPERMYRYWMTGGRAEAIGQAVYEQWQQWGHSSSVLTLDQIISAITLPLPNLWCGISAEDQPRYNARRDWLTFMPAAHRFVSLEPLLSAIDLNLGLRTPLWDGVIVGGESGNRRRQMDLHWIQAIVHQCQAWDIPVHVKQDTALRPGCQGRIPDDLFIHDWPEKVRA